jgi:hypothetical protein
VNEATATLFDEFATAYRGDEVPNVLDYLERAGDDADALADLIDRFLQAVPARESTEEEIVLAHARLEQEAPILVLRRRRALTREAVVGALVDALGLDPAKSAKVRGYYSDLEVGVLDPKPVNRRVWDALAGILKANVRVLAGLRLEPPPAPAAAYMREPTLPQARLSESADAPAPPAAEGPDEIDRLFTGSDEQ